MLYIGLHVLAWYSGHRASAFISQHQLLLLLSADADCDGRLHVDAALVSHSGNIQRKARGSFEKLTSVCYAITEYKELEKNVKSG